MRDFQSSTITQQFGVDFTFPVHFTRGVFAPANRVLRETVARVDPDGYHRLLFVVDDNVAGASPSLRQSISNYVSAHQGTLELAGDTVLVPGGETAKNDWGIVVRVLDAIRGGRLDRHSVLVVVGGGAVLDMGCFAASLAHRGVRSVRLPTTVLSQADSGVGVKNGINLFDKKNFVGVFEPPFGVINDGRFIETLPLRGGRGSGQGGVAARPRVLCLSRGARRATGGR